jgi:hypothetical protein
LTKQETTMTTKIKLSALALAAATFTTTTLLAGGGLAFATANSAAPAVHHPIFSPKPTPLPVWKAAPGGGNPYCHCGPTSPPRGN